MFSPPYEQRGGGALPDFLLCYFFPVQQTTRGIGHRVSFFGLATNDRYCTLNVRNNNKCRSGTDPVHVVQRNSCSNTSACISRSKY